MTKKIILSISLVLLIVSNIKGQENKNQISINADNIIPALFTSNSDAFNLIYRRGIKSDRHLRVGLKYFYEEDNEFNLGLKTGLDKRFKVSKKWSFYYGMDFNLIHNESFSSERKYLELALSPFFRVEFSISDTFSISTEPGLYFKIMPIKDNDNSPIDNSKSIFSSSLSNIGLINFNISFWIDS